MDGGPPPCFTMKPPLLPCWSLVTEPTCVRCETLRFLLRSSVRSLSSAYFLLASCPLVSLHPNLQRTPTPLDLCTVLAQCPCLKCNTSSNHFYFYFLHGIIILSNERDSRANAHPETCTGGTQLCLPAAVRGTEGQLMDRGRVNNAHDPGTCSQLLHLV